MSKKIDNDNKEIGIAFLNKAFDLYPEWKTENKPKFIEPTYPTKLDNVCLTRKQMANVQLDEIEKSVLCGTILGDTSFNIAKNYATPRFLSRHSTRQFTWFIWKYFVVLKEFTAVTGLVYSKPNGYQQKSQLRPGEEHLGKLQIASFAHSKFRELHNIICVKNRKKVRRFWLNHMNNYFLMTIWLDDGSLTGGRQGIISFNSMPEHEQTIFREYLDSVWDIKTKSIDTKQLMANGQKSLKIGIANQESLLKLIRLIAPVVPVREMLYKIYYVPPTKNDKSLLQRWKTELKELVKPEFADDVEEYYSNIEKCQSDSDIDNFLEIQDKKNSEDSV